MPDQPGKSSRRKAQAVNLDTIGLEMGNKPPQALEVEEAVLGAMWRLRSLRLHVSTTLVTR